LCPAKSQGSGPVGSKIDLVHINFTDAIIGGEYAVCTAQALESADSSASLQKRRGFLVTISTNLAIVSGFVGSSIVSLIVIAAYGNKASEGIWRVCFGIGIFVSEINSEVL
jgi:MFS family permease